MTMWKIADDNLSVETPPQWEIIQGHLIEITWPEDDKYSYEEYGRGLRDGMRKRPWQRYNPPPVLNDAFAGEMLDAYNAGFTDACGL